MAATGHAHADIDIGEFVEAEDEDGLVNLRERLSFCSGTAPSRIAYLEPEDFRLDEVKGLAVDLDKAFTSLRILCQILFSVP